MNPRFIKNIDYEFIISGIQRNFPLFIQIILKICFVIKEDKFDKYTDTLLYLAARNEHIKNKIKPALLKKKIVI